MKQKFVNNAKHNISFLASFAEKLLVPLRRTQPPCFGKLELLISCLSIWKTSIIFLRTYEKLFFKSYIFPQIEHLEKCFDKKGFHLPILATSTKLTKHIFVATPSCLAVVDLIY